MKVKNDHRSKFSIWKGESLIPTDLAALTKALWTIQAAKFLGNRETIMWELKLLNILVYLTLIYFDEDQEAGEDFV